MKTMNETQLKELENDLDAIRDQVISDLGERDARYIRRIVRLHRSLEIGGRGADALRVYPARVPGGHHGIGHLQDYRKHGDRPQRHARPVRLDERPIAALADL